MNTCCVLAVFLGFAIFVESQSSAEKAIEISKFKPGEDKRINFEYGVSAAGNNARNWQAGVGAAAGAKVWESKDRRANVGVGASYDRGFARFDGQTYKGRGNLGVGASFTYRFGRK